MLSKAKAVLLKRRVLAALLIVAVLAVAVFWIDGETGGEAQPADPVLMRWGNVNVMAPSRDTGILVNTKEADGVQYLSISEQGLSGSIVVDATTGLILKDDVAEGDRQAIDEVLATIQVATLDTSTAPWPYSDAQRPETETQLGLIRFFWPDPGSGIVVELGFGYGGGETVTFKNGRSRVTLDAGTGVVDHQSTSLVPDDELAFGRLLEAVTVIRAE